MMLILFPTKTEWICLLTDGRMVGAVEIADCVFHLPRAYPETALMLASTVGRGINVPLEIRI
jgi:hypothetical protein